MEFKDLWDRAEKILWALKTGHKGEEAHLRIALELLCEDCNQRIMALETRLRSTEEDVSRLQRGIKLGGGM